MAKETATLLLRRGTSVEWANKNPVLQLGEPGLDTTLRLLKIGDGATHWLDLDGFSADGGDDTDPDAGLNVVGDGSFVILEFDADASGIPDGTFIARLPEGFVP